jgi:hypothetical protein
MFPRCIVQDRVTEDMAVTCVAAKIPSTCLFPPPLMSLRLVERWMCQHLAANPHALMMIEIVACGPAGASRWDPQSMRPRNLEIVPKAAGVSEPLDQVRAT